MIRTTLSLVALVSSVFAQSGPPPAFDVASIRASQPGREVIDAVPGSLTMRNVRLTACIQWAYDVQNYQVLGPGWMDDAWFDILAKAGSPAPEPELRRMLQTLLADRFKLSLHRQTKEMEALVLTLGKNPHKLQPTETEGSPSFKTGKMNLTGQGATIRQLTDFLSREIHFPIIDETGLTGRFNYFLDVSPYVTDDVMKSRTRDGVPLDAASIVAQAIQAQLGLKVESRKVPIEVLVIDHIERTPTEN